MKRGILFFLVAMCFSSTVQAQTADPANYAKLMQVLPPSPDANALGKYGGMNLTLSSGALNLNIPVCTYTSTVMQLPISLNYNSTNIRVDEVASRVGMSWALNAGGVITRTVYGIPDEKKPRGIAPADIHARTLELGNFLNNIAIPGGISEGFWDGQPDVFMFNFNGYSGKFILDNTLSNAIFLSNTGIKIDSHFSDGNTDWTFRITTPDGVQYYFGGSAATETSWSRAQGTGISKSYSTAEATAYYLTRIVHPSNDIISFTYAPAGVSYFASTEETMLARDNRQYPTNCSGADRTDPGISQLNPKTKNELYISGWKIDEINSTGGEKIKFNYVSRLDIEDQLLSSIDVYQPGASAKLKTYLFAYQYAYSNSTQYDNSYVLDNSYRYRPFLTSITESSADGSLTKQHSFSYNDINALPPRLSFAKDHYGFFNGKANATLVPRPPDLYWQGLLPAANANREVDTNYCLKGLLTKVTYPTGGEDNIVYEPNSIYGKVVIPPPTTTISMSASGSGRSFGTPDVRTFTPGYAQTFIINASCYYYGLPENENPDPVRDKAVLTVSKGSTQLLNITISRNSGYTSPPISFNAGETYTVSLQCSGSGMTAGATFPYLDGAGTEVYKNIVVGGNRVQKITTTDPVSGKSSVKRYYYGPLSSLTQSSGVLIYHPKYDKVYPVYKPCKAPETEGNLVYCEFLEFDYVSMYSNTQSNLYGYGASPITYRSVTESFGENFENGGIEHSFDVSPDVQGENVLGNDILSAPFTSYAYRNGSEVYQHVFANKNGTFVPVKKIFTSYIEDPRVDQAFPAYIVNKKYTPQCTFTYLDDITVNAYDLVVYNHLRKWYYANNVITWTYDQSGSQYTADTVFTEYGNPSHAQPTKITTTLSAGKRQIINNAYPGDITLSGSAENARVALVNANIISPILRQQVVNNNITAFTANVEYGIFPNGLVLPQRNILQTANYPAETRIEFFSYTSNGKITEQARKDDAHEVYLWGYNNQYPVAKITGSDYNTVITSVNQSVLQNPASDDQLRAELNALRSRLAGTKALVTTYTYAPLVGITSETDPSGKTTYYEYDGLGRLKLIRDQNNNILKKFDYKYRTQ